MDLELIDLFSAQNPHEILDFRPMTPEERFTRQWNPVNVTHGIRDKVVGVLANPIDAAKETIKGKYLNDIESYARLVCDQSLSSWRNNMPGKTPPYLEIRRREYANRDDERVRLEIEKYGAMPTKGQVFFHAGILPETNCVVLDRPLSTSLSPVVAWLDALRHISQIVDLTFSVYVLKVVKPRTKVFVYDHKDLNFGHELEVLFNAGALITNQCVVGEIKKELTVCWQYGIRKEFLVRVVSAEIS